MAKTIINKNGTSKADVIEITKKVTVKALAGNDTVTIKTGSGATVYGGAGVDKIYANAGSSHKIYGEAGADTITIGKSAGTGLKVYGGNAKFTLTDKDNFVINGGKKNYLYGGKGVDTFTVNAGSSNYLYGEAGTDTFTVNGGSSNYLYGGAGVDTFVIGKTSTGTATVKDFAAGEKVKVNGTITSIAVSGSNMVIKGGKSAVLTLAGAKGKTFTVSDNKYSYTVKSSDVKYTLAKTFTGTFTAPAIVTTIDARNVTGNNVNVTGNAKANTIYAAKTYGGTYKGEAGNDNIIVTNGNTKKIYGGAGNDVLTINGDGELFVDLIDGGIGNDTINITGVRDSDNINAGAGNDIINLENNRWNTVNGGEGVDTITINSGWQNNIYGDSGNDIITINSGGGHCIYGGIGDDTITLAKTAQENDLLIDGEEGNDNIYIYGGARNRTTVNGGAGVDTIILDPCSDEIKVNGGTDGDIIKVQGYSNHTIHGGDGNDEITVENSAGDNQTIFGDLGDDTITINAGTGHTIYGSDQYGNDAGHNKIYINIGSHTINGGNGDENIFDEIYINDNAGKQKIYANAGNDIIEANAGSGHEIYGGDGEDTIAATSGSSHTIKSGKDVDHISVTGGSGHTIEGGNSSDIIIVENADSVTIYGDDNTYNGTATGDDEITVTGGNGHTIKGQKGNDTINVTGGTGHTIEGGNGNDIIEVNNVTNGTGTTIKGDDDNDIIKVTNSENVVINGDGGTDTITVTDSNSTQITLDGKDTVTVTGGSDHYIETYGSENSEIKINVASKGVRIREQGSSNLSKINNIISVDWSADIGKLTIHTSSKDSKYYQGSLTIKNANSSDFSFERSTSGSLMIYGNDKTIEIIGWNQGTYKAFGDFITIGGTQVLRSEINSQAHWGE